MTVFLEAVFLDAVFSRAACFKAVSTSKAVLKPLARRRNGSLLAVVMIAMLGRLFAQDEAGGDENLTLDSVEVTRVDFPEAVGRSIGPEGSWVPVYLELRSRGDRTELVEIEGVVRPTEKGQRFTTKTQVEVSPGAPKRAWVYLRVEPGVESQRATIEVRARGRIIRTGDRWDVSSFPQNNDMTPSMLVVGGNESDQRPWYNALGAQSIAADQMMWIQPHQLPDRSIGFDAFDIVVLRELDESKLEPSQIDAIRRHVFLGGFVIFIPGKTSGKEMFDGALVRELLGSSRSEAIVVEAVFRPQSLYYRDDHRVALPLEKEEDKTNKPPSRYGLSPGIRERLKELGEGEESYVSRKKLDLNKATVFPRINPFEGTSSLTRYIKSHPDAELEDSTILDQDGLLVYGEVLHGAGRVGVLTIDDQRFGWRESAILRQALWLQMILPALERERTPWQSNSAKFLKSTLVSSVLADRERDAGAVLIGSMVVGYLLVVGPGLYFFLRRKNKLPAIIWIEPLIILLSLGAVFATGYFSKGLRTKARFITLMHQYESSPLALRESYLSVFSADDTTYKVESRRGDLL
ncbi:MAG: hypothetical protein AAF517_25690, partial [Planctomycetota bacterium]